MDSHGDVVGADGGDSPRHAAGDVPVVDADAVLVKVVLEDLRGAIPVEELDAGLAAEDEDRAAVEGAPLGRRDDDDAGGLGPVVDLHPACLRHRVGAGGRKDVALRRAHVDLVPVGVKAYHLQVLGHDADAVLHLDRLAPGIHGRVVGHLAGKSAAFRSPPPEK